MTFLSKAGLHSEGEKIIRSSDWLISFANQNPVLRFAVLGDDNTPHVTPLWFVFDGYAFYMATDQHRKSGKVTKKVEYIKKNNKVALVIDTYNPTNLDEVQGVMVQGTAHLVQEDSESRYAVKLLKIKYREYREKYSDWLEGKDPRLQPIIIKVIPSKYIGWSEEGPWQ